MHGYSHLFHTLQTDPDSLVQVIPHAIDKVPMCCMCRYYCPQENYVVKLLSVITSAAAILLTGATFNSHFADLFPEVCAECGDASVPIRSR